MYNNHSALFGCKESAQKDSKRDEKGDAFPITAGKASPCMQPTESAGQHKHPTLWLKEQVRQEDMRYRWDRRPQDHHKHRWKD